MRTILFILLAFSATSVMAQRPGSYYNTSGQKFDGYILNFKSQEDFIHFKPDRKGHYDKISINDIKSLLLYLNVTDYDSLVVLTENGDENKKYFGAPIVASKVTSFYYKYKGGGIHVGGSTMNYSYSPNTVSIAQGNQSSVNPNATWTASDSHGSSSGIPMYSDNGTTYELTKSNFVEILGKAFADDTDLASQINSGDLKFKYLSDIFSIYKDFLDSKKAK